MISQSAKPTRARLRRVLIAEDDPNSRWVLSALLKRLGYECRAACDGGEALRLTDEFHPEIILMDLMMPGIDGLEATRRLKADARTRSIPILALTGNLTPSNERAAQEAGCDEFIPKPIVLAKLLSRVEHHLEGKKSPRNGQA